MPYTKGIALQVGDNDSHECELSAPRRRANWMANMLRFEATLNLLDGTWKYRLGLLDCKLEHCTSFQSGTRNRWTRLVSAATESHQMAGSARLY